VIKIKYVPLSLYREFFKNKNQGGDMQGKSISELQVGDSAEKKVTISEKKIDRFVQTTGDYNQIYFHDPTARERKLDEKIAPPIMLDNFTSSLIGEKLPGPGALIIGHATKYIGTLSWGSPVTILVKIEKIMPKSNQIILASCVLRTDNTVACEGKWTVSPRPAKKK
jgi:3-hydroxybutyryl-CoA dehydratase